MALSRRTPDGLVEIAERLYVFRSCLTSSVLDDDKYRSYIEDIVTQLQQSFPETSLMVFNFREDWRSPSLLSDLLSSHGVTTRMMDCPRQYEGCPVLAMDIIHHALKVGEDWIGTDGQHRILLMLCERGGWALLAFMLAALLLYRKQYSGEQSTLEMIYNQAPRELIQLLSPLNPMPSQIRYLRYVSQRNVSSELRAASLDCVILRNIPARFNGEDGCGLIFRIHGKDPLLTRNENPRVLFSSKRRAIYKQADRELIKISIECRIQGDVVLECICVDAGQVQEEMIFRVMFNTTFIRSSILMLNRDQIDINWDAKDQFPEEFRAEVLFAEMDPVNQFRATELAGKSLPIEAFEAVQELFNGTDWINTENMLLQLRHGLVSPSKNGSSIEQVTGQLELGIPAVTKGTPPPPPPPPSAPEAVHCSSSGSRDSTIASNLQKVTSLTIQVLKEITDNFSYKRKIGQGAYGRVYVGMLNNGEQIAVKMLYNVTPGIDDENFQHEFENLMMLEHQNIVRLVGYCYETQHEPMQYMGRTIFAEKIYRALCFDYMQNGSLQKHISDECDGLAWHTRYKIIRGTCEGLKYLHEGFNKPIYHLDLKPENILLDKAMVPKLADFGLSKLVGDEQTRITQSTIGTIGYLPMEYLHGGIVSNKLDIFSLGVVMIKIIAGPEGHSRSADMPRQEFLHQVHANWRNRLQKTFLSSWSVEAYCEQVNICTEIALSCMETDRHKRPTIADITRQLNHISDVLDEDLQELCSKESLAAYRNAADAASNIQAALRDRTLKLQTKAIQLAHPEIQAAAIVAAMRIQHAYRSYNKKKEMRAAARIQNHFRTWKVRRNFTNMRRQAIRIQAAYRGHQVRRQYRKVIWSVGVVEKAILRWRKKRKGLRGIGNGMAVEMTVDVEAASTAEEDYFQASRQQAEDRFNRSVVRVQALFRCHRAQHEYRRMRIAHEEAKLEFSEEQKQGPAFRS